MRPREKHNIRVIGRREFVDIPVLGVSGLEAKIDTGAYTSSIHCDNLTVNYENHRPVLYFTLDQNKERTLRFEDFAQKTIKNSFGEMEERFVIRVVVRIGNKRVKSTISLSNRDNMRYPVLIGRRLLKGKFLIDVKEIHTGGINLRAAVKRMRSNNKSQNENRNIIP
jgi:hypothetical protein